MAVGVGVGVGLIIPKCNSLTVYLCNELKFGKKACSLSTHWP
jgi:hypothetical protein